ncbi:hypothetical protein [Lyngbya sp. CCY1209]|nr:hypothetical protein [Lyngbya sp. CCY1209]
MAHLPNFERPKLGRILLLRRDRIRADTGTRTAMYAGAIFAIAF